MRTKQTSDTLIFTFSDQFSLTELNRLKSQLVKSRAIKLVLNFKDVRHLHYRVAKAIILLSQEINLNGITVIWFNQSSHVRQIFLFAKGWRDLPELFTGKSYVLLS